MFKAITKFFFSLTYCAYGPVIVLQVDLLYCQCIYLFSSIPNLFHILHILLLGWKNIWKITVPGGRFGGMKGNASLFFFAALTHPLS
jgi:hypothetical protein